MVELRWVDWGISQELEYRFVTPHVDASGALCPPGEMSEWKRVPSVDARLAYPEAFSGSQAPPSDADGAEQSGANNNTAQAKGGSQ